MDYVDQMMGGERNEVGRHIRGLVSVGAITAVQGEQMAASMGVPAAALSLPNPPFGESSRDTSRRAPLGFTEKGSGASFFTLAAAIGATTEMRAKVSRVAHVDRLLIVPSAPGVVIDSIKVGDNEQVLDAGAPAELYGPTALTDTRPDDFSPLAMGLDFIITLRNTTAGAITGTIGCKARVQR